MGPEYTVLEGGMNTLETMGSTLEVNNAKQKFHHQI
jgi:hypothetical protein